jgi:glyoxylase-like metal-dependent hydrolase (beta-lactamase superfamily II)
MEPQAPPENDLDTPRPWQKLAEALNSPLELFQNILLLRGYDFSSNIYFFTSPEPAIVDAGNDYTAFMELARLGYQPAEVRKIVLTHGHHDHAMGFVELLRSYPQQASSFHLFMHEAGPREYREFAQKLGCPVTLLKNGDTVELGGCTWEVVHVPGHTVDSICLYDAVSKTAFTGDTVLPHAMAEPDPPAGGRLDYYLLSVRQLLQHDVENILPGHGVPVAGLGRKVIEQTYESLMLKTIGVEKTTSWMNGAMQLAQRGMLPEALFCCERELAVHAEHSQALQLKIVCMNDMGRFQEALVALEQMSGLPAEDGRELFSHIATGYAMMGLGQYEQSIGHFDQALQLQPKAKEPQMYKGMALYLAGRQEEALDIEVFKAEFVGRFKEELSKRSAKA